MKASSIRMGCPAVKAGVVVGPQGCHGRAPALHGCRSRAARCSNTFTSRRTFLRSWPISPRSRRISSRTARAAHVSVAIPFPLHPAASPAVFPGAAVRRGLVEASAQPLFGVGRISHRTALGREAGASPNLISSTKCDGSRMSMDRTFAAVDRQPQATAGNHWQGQLAVGVCAVPEPQRLPAAMLGVATFTGTLNEAVRHSARDDHEIAEAIHVCAGYFSRFMRTVGQQWAKRIVLFMRETNSLAPLQWIAHEMGCDVTLRASLAHRLAAAEAQAAELRRQVHGRSAA